MSKKLTAADMMATAKTIPLQKGISFISCGETNKDPVQMRCDKHGYFTLCSFSTFSRGFNKCMKCVSESKRMSNDEMTSRIMSRGVFPPGSVFKWASPPGKREEMVEFTCPVCKEDPVLGRWSTFTSLYGNFLSGQVPCRCGKKHIWKEEELMTALVHKGQAVNLLVRGVTGTRMADKCTMYCPTHGEFTRTIRLAVHSKGGCPSCANLNHDIFYINGVYDKDLLVGLKYGLTKRNAKTNRLYLQNKKSIFDIIPLMMFSFDSPQDARDLETRLKSSLPRQFTKEEVSDGYTETCSASNLDLIISMALDAGGRKKEE